MAYPRRCMLLNSSAYVRPRERALTPQPSRTLGGMKFPKVQSLYVLDILLVAFHRRSFPLAKSHSSDLEPHASRGLSECEREP